MRKSQGNTQDMVRYISIRPMASVCAFGMVQAQQVLDQLQNDSIILEDTAKLLFLLFCSAECCTHVPCAHSRLLVHADLFNVLPLMAAVQLVVAAARML